jgi:3-oxoacyl-[acyl-carrier protein] reductase
MDLALAGKRAIITGGSRGIGQAICQSLINEGVSIATCARGEAALNQQVSAWQAAGGVAYGEALDVTDEQAFIDWFERAVAQLGGLDILISNVSTRAQQSGLERWRETFEVDLLQHIRATHLAVPHLCKGQQAAIVYLGSIASVMTANMASETEYGSFKAALIAYSAQLAYQLGKDNIRVNVVSPGPIYHENGFWDQVKQDNPAFYQRAEAISVFNRLGSPVEVANAVTFLASPAASHITGINLRVDGGAIKTVNF